MTLSNREIETYRTRRELRLGPFDMIDIRLAPGGDHLPDVLPPPCTGSIRPVFRLLALRVEASDLSPVPYTEAWLLAFGVVGRHGGWYALSHVVGAGGDLLFGREVFGYPSKAGDVDVVVTPHDFFVEGSRLGRRFAVAEAAVRGIPTGTSLSQLDVIGLRPRSLMRNSNAADLITQHWYFQGRFFQVDRSSLAVTFPEEPAAGLTEATDPWFELGPLRAMSASVIVDATMQRGPGQVVATADNFLPYYAERCDGLVPGTEASGAAVRPTFLARPQPVTRSALPGTVPRA